MTQIQEKVNDTDTLSGLLLALTALSGELPTSQIDRFPSTDAYREKVIKSLKAKKFLRTYYRDGLRGLRLTASAKEILASNQPERFQPLFAGDSVTNAPKYTVPRRLRLHRMAEVLVTMYNAGALVFPWEKPNVFRPTPPPDDTYIAQPAYYSSHEVKEIGPQGTKIRGSRATGVLLTDGGIFVIYNSRHTDEVGIQSGNAAQGPATNGVVPVPSAGTICPCGTKRGCVRLWYGADGGSYGRWR